MLVTFFRCILTQLPQDEYSILNSKHAIGIHGYVLVYSVTSRNSFDMIQIVYDKIVNYCGMNDIPCVIVGSKIDLQTRYVSPSPACHMFSFSTLFCCPYSPIVRQVKSNEGEDLAKINKAAWVETSAKNDINVGQYSSAPVCCCVLHPASHSKEKCLSCVWPKSKSGHPPVAAKYQLATSVSSCDIDMMPSLSTITVYKPPRTSHCTRFLCFIAI